MATKIYMPALGMAQTTGRLLCWHKTSGTLVTKGEPLMEIETDKTTVEIESPATGTLANVSAQPGDDVPVGQVVALILAPGEAAPPAQPASPPPTPPAQAAPAARAVDGGETNPLPAPRAVVSATPVAARMAAELNVDLNQIQPTGRRIQKGDVEAYLAAQAKGRPATAPAGGLLRASPKARRLSQELNVDLASVAGTGPEAAILAADVEAAARSTPMSESAPATEPLSPLWRVMVERLTQSWAATPQFQLRREVDAGRLVEWRARAVATLPVKPTVTDCLVKLTAAALEQHPRLNAAWLGGQLVLNPAINIGLAVAVEAGLVVPVIAAANTLRLGEIAGQRQALVARAGAGRLSPHDLEGGTFTISNLGMYDVDSFTALLNPPQAAILAVGRIVERVVPVHGQPAVRPMLTLSLTCDHRVVDGARAAEFLTALARLIEEPLGLVT